MRLANETRWIRPENCKWTAKPYRYNKHGDIKFEHKDRGPIYPIHSYWTHLPQKKV